MIKVLTVFGTRPEAIKLAPVLKRLERYKDRFASIVCSTAQHRGMLDQVLRIFNIRPQYDLNIMKPGQSLDHVTAEVLRGVKDVLAVEKPDLVLVQGDTTTTFGAALAAFYQKIKIGHIEAGLRSFNKYQPFPEEMNRRLTSVLADYHFAPTEIAMKNLLLEGVDRQKITVTGNTGIDALFMTLDRLNEWPEKENVLEKCLPNLNGDKLILVTAHRRENFGLAFREICKALVKIIKNNPGVIVVYPVHLNPNVRLTTAELLQGYERIKLVEPLEYLPFVELLRNAYLILTDSGGIQEEAPSLGKPVLVMRDVTERPEAMECGAGQLVGSKAARIVEEVQRLLDDDGEYKRRSKVKNPFGDGRASERIIDYIHKNLLLQEEM